MTKLLAFEQAFLLNSTELANLHRWPVLELKMKLHSVNLTARFQNVNNFLNANIYFYLESSDGKIYNLFLNVHFFNTTVNYTSVAA